MVYFDMSLINSLIDTRANENDEDLDILFDHSTSYPMTANCKTQVFLLKVKERKEGIGFIS